MRGRTRRYAQKRDLLIVRSIRWRSDVSFASPIIFCKKITFVSGKRDNIESCRNRTKNYLREEYLGYLQDEQLSRERKLSGLLSVTEIRRGRGEAAKYIDVAAMIARETRKEGEARGWPAMAIFRRASRCFRHETIVSCLRVRRENSEGEERVVGERKEKKSGTKDRRWLTRREGSSQHFFFVFTSARKRRSRDQKTDDRGRSQRSKDEVHDARGKTM